MLVEARKNAAHGRHQQAEAQYAAALAKALQEGASGRQVALCASALLDVYDRAKTEEKKRAIFDALRAPSLDGARSAGDAEDRKAWALLRLKVLVGSANLERDLGHYAVAKNLYDKCLEEEFQYKQDKTISDGMSNLVLVEVDRLKELQSREEKTDMSFIKDRFGKVRGRFRDVVGRADQLEKAGKFDEAEEAWKEALKLAQEMGGRACSDYRGVFHRLDDHYVVAKQPAKAIAVLKDDIEYFEKRAQESIASRSILKEADATESQLFVATDCGLVARHLIIQGKRAQGRDYLVRSIEARERLGQINRQLMNLNDILLETASVLSDVQLIEKCARRSIDLRKQLGVEVPPMYMLMLANSLLVQTRYDEAEKLILPELGRTHDPELKLRLIEQLGIARLQAKKYAEAVSISDRAVAIAKAKKLSKSAFLASVYHVRGDALQLQNSFAEAAKSYNKEREILESQKPANDMSLSHCWHGAANALVSINDFKGARKAYENALEHYRRNLKDANQYAQCLFDLCNLHRKQAQFTEAEKCMEELQLALSRKRIAVLPIVAARVMQQKADLIRLKKPDKQRKDEAGRIYRQELAYLEGNKLAGTPEEGYALFELGMIDFERGRYKPAYDFLARSLVIFEKLGDITQQIGILHRMGVAAAVAPARADQQKAQKLFIRQLELHEKLADNPTTLNFRAQGNHQLADSYSRTGEREQAARHYQESLKYYQKMTPPLVLNEGRVWQFLGDLSKARGDRGQADKYYRKAEEKLRQLSEPHRGRWLEVLEKDRSS